jgi:hypothetical protein
MKTQVRKSEVEKILCAKNVQKRPFDKRHLASDPFGRFTPRQLNHSLSARAMLQKRKFRRLRTSEKKEIPKKKRHNSRTLRITVPKDASDIYICR